MIRYLLITMLLSLTYGCNSGLRELGDVLAQPTAAQTPAVEDEEEAYGGEQRTTKFQVEKDIDTTYAKIKSEFGFITLEELLKTTNGELKSHSPAFKYDAVPGAYYHMRRSVFHTYQGEKKRRVLDVLLEKNGTSTDVIATYATIDPNIDILDLGASIEQRVQSIF